jgi:hypothetical protein
LSKRCVVAYELRGVASEYGQTPKRVLAEAIQKSRRAAQTEKSMRMSRRLADPQSGVGCVRKMPTERFVQNSVRFGCVDSVASLAGVLSESRMASKRSKNWQPLGECVTSVLRDARTAAAPNGERPAASKLN